MSASVFPARAGMSPRRDQRGAYRGCVPRASGDEPSEEHVTENLNMCSPRERG